VTYTTSTSSGGGVGAHSHQITLAQSDLASIQAGQTVTVQTTIFLSHNHGFTIQKVATAPAPTPAPTTAPTPTPTGPTY
jgi:hypothetical protein